MYEGCLRDAQEMAARHRKADRNMHHIQIAQCAGVRRALRLQGAARMQGLTVLQSRALISPADTGCELCCQNLSTGMAGAPLRSLLS